MSALRILTLVLIIVHGLIHLMGFMKGFGIGKSAIKFTEISRGGGLLWLLASILFLMAASLLLLRNNFWCQVSFAAIILSQVLIFSAWKDAKAGTIINILLAAGTFLVWSSIRFEKGFREDAMKEMNRSSAEKDELLTEAGISHLPLPVQRYLRFSGALGKPRPRNMRVVFEGDMRSKGKDYFPFRSVQYNNFEEPSRLFFMKAKMNGITVPGYHKYLNGKASMDIRLFGLLQVAGHEGPVMDTTETVTFFNDLCLLAPAALAGKNIEWENLSDTSCRAFYSNKGIRISAILYFDREGRLLDFRSEDRTEVNLMKKLPFTTPVSAYQEYKGRKVISAGEAVWHYPDGKFTYGLFRLKEIDYNLKEY